LRGHWAASNLGCWGLRYTLQLSYRVVEFILSEFIEFLEFLEILEIIVDRDRRGRGIS
jgi:hypothetical protein